MKDQGVDYVAGDISTLFIMTKVDPKTAGTDEGWIYGVFDPKQDRVTVAGAVESCVLCHRGARHDRVFGPNKLDFPGRGM